MNRNWLTLFTFLLAALCGPLASPVAAQTPANSYTAVRFDGTDTQAYGINDAGQVVGQTTVGIYPDQHGHAFLWQNGAITDLGTLPGGSYSGASRINSSGQVVGSAFTSTGQRHAFLWQNGTMIDLGTLPGDNNSTASDINDAGQVVGHSRLLIYDEFGNLIAVYDRAFLWDAATGMHDLGTLGGAASYAYAINSAGQVVGEAQAADGAFYPFRWTPSAANATTGAMAALGAFPGAARDINDSGEVVGTANGQPVRWDSSGVAHSLAVLSGYDSGSAYAINNSGEVAGDCSYTVDGGISGYDDNGNPYGGGSWTYYAAVVWDSASAVRDLNALISSGPAEVSGSLMHAVAINNSGQVVADGSTADFLLTPSPVSPRPLNLVATAGVTQVSLSWQASSGATSYRVYRSTTAGAGYAFVATATSASHTDATVTPGTTYYYVVTAVNDAGESGYSNEATATPRVTPSSWLSASGGDRKVTLAWEASPDATSYRVKRATVAGGPYTTITTTGVATTGYADTSVVNGTRYYYVVTAVNGLYESVNSPEAAATPRTPPAAPTSLSASGAKSKVNLKWTASTSAGVVSTAIYRSTTSGGTYTYISGVSSGNTYADTSVRGGVTYYYRVKAVNDNGQESAYSNQASAKPR